MHRKPKSLRFLMALLAIASFWSPLLLAAQSVARFQPPAQPATATIAELEGFEDILMLDAPAAAALVGRKATDPGLEASLIIPDGPVLRVSVSIVAADTGGFAISGETLDGAPGTFALVRRGEERTGWVYLPGQGEIWLVERGGSWVARGPARIAPLNCTATGASPLVAIQAAKQPARALVTPLSVSQSPGTTPGNAVQLPMPPDTEESVLALTAPPSCNCDDGNTIDLLCVYTDLSEQQPNAGGPGVSIQNFIATAVNASNQALASSGINLTIRIVGFHKTAYDETNPQLPPHQHIQRLQNKSDGYMDEVHGVRDQFKADLVAWFPWLPGEGGWAYGFGYEEYGFSINSSTSWVGTLAHELGHNLGCWHDIAISASQFGDWREFDWTYQYGHRFTAQSVNYACVMTYAAPNEISLLRFSNPAVNYLGTPTGTWPGVGQAAACSMAIDACRGGVSSYRDDGFADCNGNQASDALDISTGMSLDVNSNTIPDECEQRLHVAPGGQGGDGLQWNTAWSDLKTAVFSASQPCGRTTEVWVAQGTYKPDRGTGKRTMAFSTGLGGVRLFGGFTGNETSLSQRNWTAHPVVLDGDLADNDGPNFINYDENSHHVVHVFSEDGFPTLVDGFTIRSGNSTAGYPHDAGGGLRAHMAPMAVKNCLFVDNIATYGGGINFFQVGDTSQVEACTIRNNRATADGGGIQVNGAAIRLRNVEFSRNQALLGGGFLAYSSPVDARGVVFDRNVATNSAGGGMVLLAAAPLAAASSLSLATFTDNTSVWGGGLHAENISLSVRDSEFNSNTATEAGGGLFLRSASSLVERTMITGNSTKWGGGMWVQFGQSELRTSQFRNNTASLDGGGLACLDIPLLRALDCTWIQNSSSAVGGGMRLYASNTVLERCTVGGNSSAAQGGGVGAIDSSYKVINSIFSGNSAILDGAAVYASNCSGSSLINCTVVDHANRSLVNFGSAVTVNNTIVWHCLAAPLSSGFTVNYSNIQAAQPGPGNISSQPLFISRMGADGQPGTGDENMGLLAGSPGIDAGNNQLMLASGAERPDMDWTRRRRFKEDLNTPDTGVGPAPVIDIGAREK